MSKKEAHNAIKILRHIPALFSIAMVCVILYQGPPNPFEPETNFYTLNFLFALGVIAYVLLEYWFLDASSYRFRRFSLWAAALVSLSIVLEKVIIFFFLLVAVSPFVAILLVIFSFIGKQPKVIEGRFYPAIFSLLSVFWNLAFLTITT